MKTTINKSQLMQRAWSIYRMENNTVFFGRRNRQKYEFRFALRRAWKEVKSEMNQTERVSTPVTTIEVSESYMAGCAEYYRTAPRGTYFGD